MFSRLTAAAALFAVVATATLTYAADPETGNRAFAAQDATRPATSTPAVVILPTVYVTGKRVSR